ncbi:MAG: hypothetical protein PHS88_07870 [Candidatus Omnitrophica bacterium]|nr:hypothetical protein [Candidatus Omnitrophota bacterium]
MAEEKAIYESMSNAELEVAEYLKRINIYWLFENPIFLLDEKERPRVWTPDFYLPELGIYVEVCGDDRACYSYRETIYKKNRIPVIFIHQFKREDDWQEFLKKRIVEINENRSKKVLDSLMRKA